MEMTAIVLGLAILPEIRPSAAIVTLDIPEINVKVKKNNRKNKKKTLYKLKIACFLPLNLVHNILKQFDKVKTNHFPSQFVLK